MHLGAHIPNLYMVESVRAFAQTYFPILSNLAPRAQDGYMEIPEGPGLGVDLRPEALSRDDLSRHVSDEGELRAAGDDWAFVLGFTHTPQ